MRSFVQLKQPLFRKLRVTELLILMCVQVKSEKRSEPI